jgi:hypothetical protein
VNVVGLSFRIFLDLLVKLEVGDHHLHEVSVHHILKRLFLLHGRVIPTNVQGDSQYGTETHPRQGLGKRNSSYERTRSTQPTHEGLNPEGHCGFD